MTEAGRGATLDAWYAASRRTSLHWLGAGLLCALLLVLYFRIGTKLVTDWATLTDFSHGFLIPFFIAYVLWNKADQIRSTPLRPTWAGLLPVAAGVALLLVGVYGADLFLSRISFVLVVTGLVWTFAGSAMLRVLRLPLAAMLLAIPLPAIVFNQLTLPLQLLASSVASAILPLAGVPVLREGNIIQLPTMQLEVAEACSGIRSLLSLFTCAVIFGYLAETHLSRRLLLMLASLPIAIVANVIRIVGTGVCVQYWNPARALGFFHEFSGWLMFVVSLLCLTAMHRLSRSVQPAGHP